MYSVDTRTLEVIETTQSRKKNRVEASKIIIDVRELRSDLPNILHGQGPNNPYSVVKSSLNLGLELSPMTLVVGDYILSPTIAVERKVRFNMSVKQRLT